MRPHWMSCLRHVQTYAAINVNVSSRPLVTFQSIGRASVWRGNKPGNLDRIDASYLLEPKVGMRAQRPNVARPLAFALQISEC